MNRQQFQVRKYTERIAQFGEGNFLRAFADWMVQRMNKDIDFDGGVVAVQPINQGMISKLNDQEGLYTVYLNGIKSGEAVSEHELIDCITRGINPYENYKDFLELAKSEHLRFVISNTTEAGISYEPVDQLTDEPPSSFPAKVTVMLYRRFEQFKGNPEKGLIFLPCELIDRNGDNLKRIVLQYAEEWKLSDVFKTWVKQYNVFTNTLVDRIVPGFPKDKIQEINEALGYDDQLVVEGEQFHLWVIEGPEQVKAEFPADRCDLNVIFTDDMQPYRTRKVRILNGAHTVMVPVAYLYGIEYVRESMEDDVIGAFVKESIYNEIIPTLSLPDKDLKSFANDVLDRFRNPYLKHALISISLNSFSKFKARVLPSLLAYVEIQGSLPSNICISLAAMFAFYKGEVVGKTIALNDDPKVLDFAKSTWGAFEEHADLKKVVQAFLSEASFWGQDLTLVNGMVDSVSDNLKIIIEGNIEKLLKK